MLMSEKAIEQRQEAEARVAQMKVPRKMDSGSLYQYKYDDHNIDES